MVRALYAMFVKEFADRWGEEAGDAMFPRYGEWRKKEAERLQKEGMPWDQ